MRPLFPRTSLFGHSAYRHMQRFSIAAAAMALLAAVITPPARAAPDHWANGAVPMSDQRDMRKAVVRTIAARLSDDALTVAVYGADTALLGEIKAAVREAHMKGWPVLGIVVGSTGEPRGVDIYADGLLIAEQSKPGASIRAQTLNALAYGNDLLKHELKPRPH